MLRGTCADQRDVCARLCLQCFETACAVLHLCYERHKVSKLLVVLAGLEIEDVQACLVVTPLQSEIVCMALWVSLNAAL